MPTRPAIDLPALVTSLNIDLSGVDGAIADGARRGSAVGAAIGEGVRTNLTEALTHLPEVEIDADSSDLDRDLAAMRKKLATLSEKRIGIDIDVPKALREADDIRLNLDRLRQTHTTLDVDARANIQQALDQLALLQARAEDNPPVITPEVDPAAALAGLDEVEASTRRLRNDELLIIPVVDPAAARGGLDEVAAAARRLADETPVITPEVDAAPAIAEASLLRRALRDLGDEGGTTRGALAGLGGVLGGLGGAFGSLAKLSVVPQLVGVGAGLAQLAPAAGVAATAVLAAGSALAAIKLGTHGLSDALQGDKDALDKLAPSARGFVGAVKAVTPEFNSVRRSIQQSLFADLGPTLEKLARTTLPSVRAGLTTTATSLNAMGRSTAGALDQLAKTGTLRSALTGVGKDLGSLKALPGQLITGLVQIGAAAQPAFAKLTVGLGGAASSVSAKLTAAFKSGGLQKAISGAAALIGQLVGALANVGRALANVFGPALQGGNAFISTFSQIAQLLADMTGSEAAQQAFAGLFGVLRSVSGLISGTLSVALRSLLPLAEQLVTALSGPLQQVIGTLGPVLARLVGALTKALGPVVTALGKGIGQIAPVLGSLAQTIGGALTPVLGVLGELLASLLPPIAAIVAQVGRALGPVLVQVGQILAQVGGALLNLLAPVLKVLPSIIAPIVSVAGSLLTTFGSIVAQVLGALGPALGTLGGSLATLGKAVAPLLAVLGQLIGQGLQALMPIITPLIDLIGKLASIIADVLAQYIKTILVPAIHLITDLLHGNFHAAFKDAEKVVSGMVQFALTLFVQLPGKLYDALKPLPGKLWTAAQAAGARLLIALTGKVTSAITLVKGLPGKAAAALAGLGGKLVAAGRSLITGFINGIKDKIPSVTGVLKELTNLIPKVKGPPKRDATLLTPAGRLLIQGLVDGIDAATPSLKKKLTTLTDDIERAVKVNAGNRRKVGGLSTLLAQVKGDNRALLALAGDRDRVADVLKRATDRLATLQKASADVSSKISSGILSDANITSGNSDVATIAGITQQLSTSAAQAKQFAGQIAALKKAGLSGELLQELADAGVSGGEAAAKALAGATPAQIKAINAQQAALDKAAAATGSTVATSLYGAGIQAAQGLVAGLKSQEKDIEAAMEKIAASMAKAIRKALGIKSPSRVMAEVGGFAGDGVVQGLTARFGAIRDAATQAGQLVAQAAQGAAAALGGVPTAGQLRPLVAGASPAPYQPVNHFHLYGSDASPGGISRQLAWDAKVGRR